MELFAQLAAKLKALLPGAVSLRGGPRYVAATAIWPRSDRKPVVVVHCSNAEQVRIAIMCTRDAGLPLSVRGGGHDWAGRALCGGVVIDLTPMRQVALAPDLRSAVVGGGCRGIDLFPVTDPRGVAVVTGSAGVVGLAGLTLGGGYGPLNGRFGLACDGLISAEVALADGRIVTAGEGGDAELLWALRGGGGNFGVVTSMRLALHDVPSVRSGLIIYLFQQAQAVLDNLADIIAAAPDALDIQIAFIPGPDGDPVLAIMPTWSGAREKGEMQVAPLQALGTPVMVDMRNRSYGESRTLSDAHIVDGRHTFMTTRWLPRLHSHAAAVLIEQMRRRPSRFCFIITHNLHGAATRIGAEATAFGFRQPHVMIEILAQAVPREGDGAAERAWVIETAAALESLCLPGAYANLIAEDDRARACHSFGPNAERLIAAKRRYDPTNVFASAIPLPIPARG
jgi:FAD/FMN-containing dehydrogenase